MNDVYFIGMFLRFWLIWLIIFLAPVVVGPEIFLSVNIWTPWAAVVAFWSCTIMALCVSIGWVIYSVRNEYLATTEYPPSEFLNNFRITCTKRS